MAAQYSEAEARLELSRRIAANVAPVISDATLDDLIRGCRRPDLMGRSPSDVMWIPTFDIAYAEVRGWDLKLALLSSGYDFSADGSKFSLSQAFDQAKTMRAMAAKRCTYAVKSPKPILPTEPVPPVVLY